MLDILRQLDILVYPPAINILLLVIAIFFWRQRKLALSLVSISLATLILFSLPAVSQSLLYSLEDHSAIPPTALRSKNAQAVVVLGGGFRVNAIEYGGSTLANQSLARLRYAAYIHRQTGVPILFSGGYHLDLDLSEAKTAKHILNTEFYIQGAMTESESRTTRENASMSADILKTKNIKRVFLVTNGWHMKRAVALFEESGIEVVPAPTEMAFSNPPGWRDFLPNGEALAETRMALHEYLGRLLYFL